MSPATFKPSSFPVGLLQSPKIWIFSTKRSASWADVRCSVDHNESEGMKLRKLKMIKKRLVIDNAYKTL